MDIASSIQSVIEEIIIKMSIHFKDKYKIDNLCLAGGVCLNCVANGKLLDKNIFKNIWIQPAAGDAGGALGGALAFWYMHLEKPRKYSDKLDEMKGSFLGPCYKDNEIEDDLIKNNAKYTKSQKKMINYIHEIADGKSIGWLRKMEFGPRALAQDLS